VKDVIKGIAKVNSDEKLKKSDAAALYGATSKITDPKMLGEIYMKYLDVSMSIDPEKALYGLED